MSGSNDGRESWGSKFLKVASAAAATGAVAGGLYALLSSSDSANSEPGVLFGAQPRPRETPLQVNNEGATTVTWKKPKVGWVKLNVDGSHDPNKSFSAGCGGVVRDASGKWLYGFAQKLDPDTYDKPNKTELQAILTGMQVAWEMNAKKVVVESDSESVVNMVKNQIKRKKNRVVVEDILKLFDLDREVELVFISNKANRVADRLANAARSLPSYNLCKYRDPPANCIQLLKDDLSSSNQHSNGSKLMCSIKKSGNNDESRSRGSTCLKVASATAATVAIVGGLYFLLSPSASANSELEVPFGAQHEHREGDEDGPWSRHHETLLQGNNVGALERWKKPEIGWMKLNVDGSCDHEGPSAGCGGVLRDAGGMWLLGFAQKVDPTFKTHQTELQAILTGLELAWEMNVEKLVVESDSDSMVSMVENGRGFKNQRPEYDVVQRIRELRFDPKWQVRLVSVPRTVNRVANKLANDARKLFSDDLYKYLSPPDNCTQLFLEDNGEVFVSF